MANISTIRTALANQIAEYAFPALRVEANPYDQINPPCAMILPGKTVAKYGRTLGGPLQSLGGTQYAATDFNLDVLVIVSHASTIERVQQNLDQWLGFEQDETAVSVPMAIDRDITLGGVVEWCVPDNCDSYGPIEWNGTMYFGARIHCAISLR
jgi:hypothetical protein